MLSIYKTIQCILKDCEVNSRLMCNYYVLRQTKESVLVGLNAKCVITLHNGDITPKGSSSISKLASMFFMHVQHTNASIMSFCCICCYFMEWAQCTHSSIRYYMQVWVAETFSTNKAERSCIIWGSMRTMNMYISLL